MANFVIFHGIHLKTSLLSFLVVRNSVLSLSLIAFPSFFPVHALLSLSVMVQLLTFYDSEADSTILSVGCVKSLSLLVFSYALCFDTL